MLLDDTLDLDQGTRSPQGAILDDTLVLPDTLNRGGRHSSRLNPVSRANPERVSIVRRFLNERF